MTPEEIYQIWAPADSVWSPWAIPVPFAQIVSLGPDAKSAREESEAWGVNLAEAGDLAIVVDLPGGDAIRLGLALAFRGFRPVPVIDGSPGPFPIVASYPDTADTVPQNRLHTIAVDMRELLRGLCSGAVLLKELTIPADARPVFLLDAARMAEGREIGPEMFDNRWKTLPQDFPSGRMLLETGIRRVLLVQQVIGQPKEDLAHVLLRWQEAGISIYCATRADQVAMEPLQVSKPRNFRSLWYRALALLGLRRGAGGGFGAWPPESKSG